MGWLLGVKKFGGIRMSRMRQNIVVGAPEVKSGGAAWIGMAGINPLQTPHSASVRVASLPAVNKFSPAGYISEDGLTKTVDRDTEKVVDWNGDTMAVLQSNHSVQIKCKFHEIVNSHVATAVMGEGNFRSRHDGRAVQMIDNATETPYRSFIFDIHGGEDLKGRLFIPNGRVTELDDQVFSRGEVVGFDATIECFPDEKGNNLYTYIDRRNVKKDTDDRFPDDGLPVVSLAEIEDIVRNALNGLPISPDLVAGLFYSLIDGKGGLNLEFIDKLAKHLAPLNGVDDVLQLLSDLVEGKDAATLIKDVEALPFTPLNRHNRWAQAVVDLLTGSGGRQTIDDLTGGII